MKKMYKLPEQTTIPGFRKLTEEDIPEARELLNGYLKKMRISVLLFGLGCSKKNYSTKKNKKNIFSDNFLSKSCYYPSPIRTRIQALAPPKERSRLLLRRPRSPNQQNNRLCLLLFNPLHCHALRKTQKNHGLLRLLQRSQ